MKNRIFLIIICSLAFLSCSRDKEVVPNPPPQPPPVPSTSPVETNAPNSNYSPAFPGQTRVAGMTTSVRYQVNTITTSLVSPWGITALPDGRLLITEKAGRMRIVTTSGSVSEPISGIPQVNPAGQGGLLGICLDPDFANNRMIYWSFSEPNAGGSLTAIAKGRLATNETALEGVTVMGGRLLPMA